MTEKATTTAPGKKKRTNLWKEQIGKEVVVFTTLKTNITGRVTCVTAYEVELIDKETHRPIVLQKSNVVLFVPAASTSKVRRRVRQA